MGLFYNDEFPPIIPDSLIAMYKLCFFVPESHLEIVKQALFAKGAGRFGQYDCCCWQTRGQGQFRPLEGSSPHLGNENELETLEEFKVEMICADECLKAVLIELLEVHPYEEPAYEAYPIQTLSSLKIS